MHCLHVASCTEVNVYMYIVQPATIYILCYKVAIMKIAKLCIYLPIVISHLIRLYYMKLAS